MYFKIPTLSPILLLVMAFVSAGCGARPKSEAAIEVEPEFLRTFKVSPVVFDSSSNPVSEEKTALGRMLYYDPRLSRSQTVSCNTCHPLDKYGVDGLPVSKGHNNQTGSRNAPTVYYAAGHVLQFWDGRAADVEEQAKGPMLNPVEMGLRDGKHVEAILRSIPEYVEAFRKAFPTDKDPVTFDNAARAIAAFERKLVTPSRWDRFLAGDRTALSAEEKQGFLTFYKAGCHTCHNGPMLGGRLFQKAGLVKPWPSQKDMGRYEVTRQEHDRMLFKVPALRNIEKTAPYFHDGGVVDLEHAVRMMGEHQVERPLTEIEVKQIVTFLKTLTGDLPRDYIRQPELPPSTERTPKPSAD